MLDLLKYGSVGRTVAIDLGKLLGKGMADIYVN
jgi:hypothetical protein